MTSPSMHFGERQMLVEYSSHQMIKAGDCGDERTITFGTRFLSKIVSRGSGTTISLHVLTDFFSEKLASKYASNTYNIKWLSRSETALEGVVQFLFDLFVATGSSSCQFQDIDGFLESMKRFDAGSLEHPYDQAIYKILNKVSESEIDGKDKILRRIMLEAPALPPSIIFDFFKKQLSAGSTTAVSALIIANGIMEFQPILKPILLECVLETCISDDDETREKGIRLVKNRLHQEEDLSDRIERFALEALQQLQILQPEPAGNEASGKFCHLFLALCTRKASLLRKLHEVFAKANETGRRIIQENTKQLSEAAHFLLPELLSLIENFPDGSEPLLLLLLSIFPENGPPQIIIDACIDRYNETKNVRFLLPTLFGLPKKKIMEIVPLLAQLPVDDFSKAISNLVTGKSSFGEVAIEPSEILVTLATSLHMHESLELNAIITSLDYCIKQMAQVFDKEVLAGALNKLVHINNLPLYFMRMVLLSISREKDLETFVLQTVLAPSVVASKVKLEKTQWEGYLLLLQKTMPASFRHLLTLPTRLMMSALDEMPQTFREKFHNFVEGEDCDMRVPNDALSAIREAMSLDKSSTCARNDEAKCLE